MWDRDAKPFWWCFLVWEKAHPLLHSLLYINKDKKLYILFSFEKQDNGEWDKIWYWKRGFEGKLGKRLKGPFWLGFYGLIDRSSDAPESYRAIRGARRRRLLPPPCPSVELGAGRVRQRNIVTILPTTSATVGRTCKHINNKPIPPFVNINPFFSVLWNPKSLINQVGL